MHPAKVIREKVIELTDLPNIGKAMAGDLRLLGITKPEALIGQCPYQMYDRLCRMTGVRHDPCVIDVFIAITRFMAGQAARPWWDFSDERKNTLRQRQR
jgi:Pathogenicity locus